MSVKWLEASVETDNETSEAVLEVFSRYASRRVIIEAGPGGWNTGQVIVRAYLRADEQLGDRKRCVEESFWHLRQIGPVSELSFHPVAEADWTKVRRKRLKVLRVGCVVIRPPWLEHTPVSGEIVVQLDCKASFGAGLHPTTQMCLLALEKLVHPEVQMLDLGTGTGILAIAAAKQRAGRVLAMDKDSTAIAMARENVARNGVRNKVSLACGTLADVSESYDLVVVNILTKAIVKMAQQGLAERVRPGGRLIASGILADQEPEVAAALEQASFDLVERRQMGDWVCLIAKRRDLPDR